MGILDGISAGLTAATKAATGAAQGQQQGSQLLRAIQMQQYQIQKEQAETDLARTHAKYFQRESDTPRLGDPNYGTALGDAEAGKIRGATPAKAEEVTALAQPTANAAATMVNTTAQPKANAAALEASATLPMKKDLDAYSQNQAGNKDIRVSHETVPDKVAVSQQSGHISQAGANAFVKANKPLSDAVVPYAAAKNAFAQARAGNPAALKSAILSFAGVADPKANLRQGVINMISQVDPSVRGNFDLALARLSSGTLPPRILDDMERLVDQTHKTHRDLYEQRRTAVVGRQPALDPYIPTTDETFNVPGVSSTPAATGTDSKGTYTFGGKTYKVPQ